MHSIAHINDFRGPILAAQKAGHRLMLVLAMPQEEGLGLARRVINCTSTGLWVDVPEGSHSHTPRQRHITSTQANQYLGTGNDWVVFSAHNGFNANAFCGLSGTVAGGGVMLLLTPPMSQWHTNFDQQLRAYGQLAPQAHSSFVYWWHQQWPQHRAIYLLQETDSKSVEAWPMVIHNTPDSIHPTSDQQKHINDLIDAYNQQVPMVYTLDAHRGRGKSACLGWLINAITPAAEHGPVLVTAPSKRAIESMAQMAGDDVIHFYALDVLIKDAPKAGLLLVDEAAAIPLSQLTKIIQRYPLIVLSSTRDGYEGSGQGYRLKLPRMIEKLGRTQLSMTLTEPMRWRSHDPLEKFVRRTFLCDLPSPNIPQEYVVEPYGSKKRSLSFTHLSGQELAKNTPLLKQVYGLLMLAHYQTTPTDLRILLDHPHHSIYLCQAGDQLLGVAWVAKEGGLEKQLCQQIALGKRRIQGHLLAQILAQQAGFSQACELTSWRIQRLAVSPSVQGKGIGSILLHHLFSLAADAQVDFVGASFSASIENLSFWQKNEFVPVWLGIRADAATGLNSIQVLRPISPAAHVLRSGLLQHFYGYLKFGERVWFSDVDPTTWQKIIHDFPTQKMLPLNTSQQRRMLDVFAHGQAGFCGPLYLLHQLLDKDEHQQELMHAAQNHTHKGLQSNIRELATSLLESISG